MGRPLLAVPVLTFMIVAAGLEFGYYLELYDGFFPRAECRNVSAVLEPRGSVKRQLIFSAHHDAAQELKFLRSNQKLYGLKILIPDAFRMLACVTAWIWWGNQILTGSVPGFVWLAKIILVLGIPVVFTKFSLFTKNVSPGAGDNLIASAMLVELASRFSDPGRMGVSTLEHTRLIFTSFDAEESGLRGSRAWVKAHRSELTGMPTFALNIDSIYHLKDLQFLVSDLNDHVRLDLALALNCVRLAGELGYPAKKSRMRFGGGGTDAAELARVGIHATTMIAMPTALVREGLVYHTMHDTVDAIEPEAVSACLAVAGALAHHLDQKDW